MPYLTGFGVNSCAPFGFRARELFDGISVCSPNTYGKREPSSGSERLAESGLLTNRTRQESVRRTIFHFFRTLALLVRSQLNDDIPRGHCSTISAIQRFTLRSTAFVFRQARDDESSVSSSSAKEPFFIVGSVDDGTKQTDESAVHRCLFIFSFLCNNTDDTPLCGPS
ncbi:hypothetical protein TTRE_0000234601 [Trichuris trichiura]|uniref:Uncharacterized protein n=1 Tax=Trichuris trichiura TaxID=36087 RepID=A0A077Z0V9_TRITR|nr:hypothetical protein TTRE_0000234601 [Trichuris trichiura]